MKDNTTTVEETDVLKTKRVDMFMVDPQNIIIEDGFNVRTDYGDIEGLMRSIVENGLLEPITVSKVRNEDKYILTDGHRRMKAIMLGIERGEKIPYVKAITSSSNPEDRLFAMVITGVDKKPLNNLEEGEAYKRLIAFEYSVKDIAHRIGKSNQHVYNMLKLADLPKAVKNHIVKGSISGGLVLTILKDAKTPEDIIAAVDNAILNAEIEHEDNGSTSGKPVKAKASHAGVKSPMKKLEEALIIAIEKGYVNGVLLDQLLVELRNPKSDPKNIAKLFKI